MIVTLVEPEGGPGSWVDELHSRESPPAKVGLGSKLS